MKPSSVNKLQRLRSWAGGTAQGRATLQTFLSPSMLASLLLTPCVFILPADRSCCCRTHQRLSLRMTSPAITKSPENQKTEKKSPTHSTENVERPPSRAASGGSASASAAPEPSGPFSWMRIFKLADLMMKQGC